MIEVETYENYQEVAQSYHPNLFKGKKSSPTTLAITFPDRIHVAQQQLHQPTKQYKQLSYLHHHANSPKIPHLCGSRVVQGNSRNLVTINLQFGVDIYHLRRGKMPQDIRTISLTERLKKAQSLSGVKIIYIQNMRVKL